MFNLRRLTVRTRRAVVFLGLVALSLTVQFTSARAAERPNIVFVMIDDLGWMDLACQGNQLVETPNIDKLASEGMRFTDAYAAAPVCSPTRAAVMTGLAPARLKITNHTPDQARFMPENAKLQSAHMEDHLEPGYVTIAERLKEAGYATGFLGKWHLSGPRKGRPEWEPQTQGFDLNIGGCGYGGPPTFFDPYNIPNLKDRRKGEYLPDRLTDEAIQFIEKNKEGPFYLCLWNYTVHWPMEAPEALLAKYSDRIGRGLNDTRYGAMIEAMDAAIGRILKRIDELKLRENTFVVFTSDNGGFGGVSDCRPLRESKGYLYEGGIRVPLIVRWPGVTKPGSICKEPVVSMDFYQTLLDVAQIPTEESQLLDGVSLLPVLHGGESLDRDALYFHYPNYAFHQSNRLGSAIRAGRFKLIENFDDGSVELYDLQKDIGERRDLAKRQPDVAKRLQTQLAAWRQKTDAELPTPNPNHIPEEKLPKVLIIGDSISIGYMKPLVQLMKNQASVKHNPGNARHTGIGVEKIDDWLGDTDWDVIHFNWGLHDLCYRNPKSKTQGSRDKVNGKLDVTIEEYEANLEKLVTRLKKTDASLIWASTTVVPSGEAGRIEGDDLRYNKIAERVMKKHGIPINDLNKKSREFDESMFSGPGNVHFKPEGSEQLAKQVAGQLRNALKQRREAADSNSK